MKPYNIFTIYDPKERKISAPSFRDHVVAHAIHRILYPILDKEFIYDSYGSRKEKGPRKAIERAQKFSRKFSWFLKVDISKYFESIDREKLKDILRKRFKDEKLIKLLSVIIDNPIPDYEEGKGISLGHLSSQIFANLYLDKFDHVLKEQVRIKGYVRYIDDILIFADDKEELKQHKNFIEKYLKEELKLKLKESATILAPIREGIPFLSFLIYPKLIRIRNKNLQRARRTLKKLEKKFLRGKITKNELASGALGLIEYIKIGNTYNLRKKWLANRKIEV